MLEVVEVVEGEDQVVEVAVLFSLLLGPFLVTLLLRLSCLLSSWQLGLQLR